MKYLFKKARPDQVDQTRPGRDPEFSGFLCSVFKVHGGLACEPGPRGEE